MTISTTHNRHDYTASADQTTFAYTFLIHAESDLEVYVNSVLKTLTVDYTVSAIDDPSGGNVVLGTGADADDEVLILRVMPITSLVNYVASGVFPPETANDMFEKIIMITQQLQEQLDRTLKLANTSTISDVELGGVSTRAAKGLRWNTAGTDIEEYTISSSDTLDVVTTKVISFKGALRVQRKGFLLVQPGKC